jgi:TPR repeat protein
MLMTRREYKELYLHHYSRAEKGNVESSFKLGEIYEYGRGVVKDYKLAEFWYLKAAEKKHPTAKLNLSWLRLKKEDSSLHDPIFHQR